LNLKAVLDHEKVCNGAPTTTTSTATAVDNPAKLPRSEIGDGKCDPKTTKKQSLITEEDVAGDFIHATTGQYKSLTDDVPDHINPNTGWFK